jgi:sodium transport system ATP-binding protein
MARRAVLDAVRDYPGERRAVVYSTHVMSEVEELCDRVCVLYRGRVIATGTVAELVAQGEAANLERAFFTLVERSGLAGDELTRTGAAA